jgi:nicotinate-nucleotide adenylyltransferase
LARAAASAYGIDSVLWVLAQDPPHKTRPGTPFEHRFAMVKLAIAGIPGNAASDVEAKLPTPSYSLNTIQALKRDLGADHEWFFLIGADNWAIFPTWHRPEEVLRQVTLLVYPRSGHALAGSLPEGVRALKVDEVPGESRRIRAELEKTGDLHAAGVLPELREYIVRHGLYGIGSGKAH